MRTVTRVATLVSAALLSCTDGTSVEDLRTPLDPPALYRIWWDETHVCAFPLADGPTRDFGGITWFVTPEFPGQPNVLGQWNERREITILDEYFLNPEVVKHEMLHDILAAVGDRGHDSPSWGLCALPVGVD
jgi:hypothetical protein